MHHLLQTLAKYMIGRSAFNIRHTAQVVFDDFAMRRASLDLLSAWSAIEIALWDIVAKHANLPLYNLLGGASRERSPTRIRPRGTRRFQPARTNLRRSSRSA